MGYIKGIQTDDLHLPSDPAWVVTLRRKAPFGADLAMQDAMVKITPEDMDKIAQMGKPGDGSVAPLPKGLSKIEVAASKRAMILAFIVSWNLTDESDQPLPLSPESIDALEPEDGYYLENEVKKRVAARRSEESRRPFGKRSGSPSVPSLARVSRHPGS